MCGIVGLFLKDEGLRGRLGAMFGPMLAEMSDRGPDSAGFAIYRADVSEEAKATLYDPDENYDWSELTEAMSDDFGAPVAWERMATHAILHGKATAAAMRDWLVRNRPGVRVMSTGSSLEIYKEIGLPADVMSRFGVSQMAGSHMIGHTRMATESAVTTEGAHPFNTGEDLCLVHNGSLSNHNSLKRMLMREGLVFQTQNDSEVAAGYLAWRLSQGAALKDALEASVRDLDGFYTFTVGTKDGFAVLRDPIACKPAVIAESDDWVAMASEYRALARLPGVEKATVWEPKPGTVYSWGHA
ncbi:class II glutamine amidotransferase [Hwanghaeella sp.]|uniref:class II glutamine amidotransferase n=1 Tax=Hwanghaeella sp. TaxID=2605943 RepID=UPI003CCC181E